MYSALKNWAVAGLRPMVRALRGAAPPDPHGRDYVGYLRYLQNRRETGVRKNPDTHVGFLLRRNVRASAIWADLARYRGDAFYHYLLARTRFYDEVFLNALSAGVQQILILGAGTDTRAYRLGNTPTLQQVRVFETDLEPWISERSALSGRIKSRHQIHRSSLDLAKDDLSGWVTKAKFAPSQLTLLLAEGVTPYLRSDAVDILLDFMSKHARAGSWLAYDFKRLDVNGKPSGEQSNFGLPSDVHQIKRYHDRFQLAVERFFLSEELGERYLDYDAPKYREDGVVIATMQPGIGQAL